MSRVRSMKLPEPRINVTPEERKEAEEAVRKFEAERAKRPRVGVHPRYIYVS